MPSVPLLKLVIHMLRGRPTFQDPELSPTFFQIDLYIRRCVLALVCCVCNAVAALDNHEHIQAEENASPPVILCTFCELIILHVAMIDLLIMISCERNFI